jgi:hypothetical protein
VAPYLRPNYFADKEELGKVIKDQLHVQLNDPIADLVRNAQNIFSLPIFTICIVSCVSEFRSFWKDIIFDSLDEDKSGLIDMEEASATPSFRNLPFYFTVACRMGVLRTNLNVPALYTVLQAL